LDRKKFVLLKKFLTGEEGVSRSIEELNYLAIAHEGKFAPMGREQARKFLLERLVVFLICS
jgi:hypothetical protein